MAKGPTYGVELIRDLQFDPSNPRSMRQAMPSRGDLQRAVDGDHMRLAAGYEVLLGHYHRAVELIRRIDRQPTAVKTHVGTGEPHYLFSCECSDFAELTTLLDTVRESLPA